MPKRRKIGLNMRADIYDRLAKLAKENGQTTTYVRSRTGREALH
jgi:hypothetical protein